MRLFCAVLLAAAAAWKFRSFSSMRPGLGKEAKGGEDAFLASGELIAVADGVGGWNSHGVDPGVYSKKLVQNLEEFFARDRKKFSENPKELLIMAAENNRETGSSTFVVGTIDQRAGLLKVANLGDSGYALFAAGNQGYRQKFRSEEQQHSFNFPFQVGTNGDNPAKADLREHRIEEGDLVVMATDGLFDNLFDDQVEQIVNRHRGRVGQALADELVKAAFELSIDPNYDSPFALHARSHRKNFRGGKNDDITVIVAELVQDL